MALRDQPDLEFASKIFKIELHAHLTGSISRHCLHQIWALKKAAGASLDLKDPLIAIPPGKVDYDLTTFFPLFSSYIYKLCSDIQSIRFSTLSVLADFNADNVVYLELRTTPRAIPNHGISKQLYVETVLSCIEEYETDPAHRLRTRLILSVDRSNGLAEANEVVDIALSFRSRGIVGVDLCGNPAKGPINHFAPAFARARTEGLKITLHFAEAPPSSSDEELWTLLSWQPDRVGHVIHVTDDLKQEIVKRRIGVELCLSCNVHAKMITGSYSDHHFSWWFRHHDRIALSTDDVGVFCSPLSEEYRLAAEHFNLAKSDLQRLAEGVIEVIFADDREKARLRQLFSTQVAG